MMMRPSDSDGTSHSAVDWPLERNQVSLSLSPHYCRSSSKSQQESEMINIDRGKDEFGLLLAQVPENPDTSRFNCCDVVKPPSTTKTHSSPLYETPLGLSPYVLLVVYCLIVLTTGAGYYNYPPFSSILYGSGEILTSKRCKRVCFSCDARWNP